MNTLNKIKIFLVDDDVVFLKSLEIEFRQQGGYEIETFVSGETCLASMSSNPDVIILDYLLDGTDKNAMNGITTLDKLRALKPAIPVIMLSAQDKIEVAIDCMHHKAFDYVVKSETAFLRLEKIIATAFQYREMEKRLMWYMSKV